MSMFDAQESRELTFVLAVASRLPFGADAARVPTKLGVLGRILGTVEECPGW